MKKYLTAIGLEAHVQLKTKSKMFCGCSTEYGAEPNTHVCPVCLGYPGVLPVMNEEAIRLTVITGLMVGCQISRYSKFDRKSYFYPDMPKNYQISQYDKPLCEGGSIVINVDGVEKTVDITRIHLEEDVGKNMDFRDASGIDFNRAGIPLMEIVSEPVLTSPEEAYSYLQALKLILLYAGVSNCNLEDGNVRCDVNCSVRPAGQLELGTKTEIKNLNTFKGVLNALKYETNRQIDVVESGGKIQMETRRWDVDAGVTTAMRSKEEAHDYRYFPEPDLMPVAIAEKSIQKWKDELPESPLCRHKRFVADYHIPEYDAGVLVADRSVADFFDAAANVSSNPKAVSNWVMTEVMRLISEKKVCISDACVTPQCLAKLIELVDKGIINMPAAREVFEIMFREGGDPKRIVDEKGISQVNDMEVIKRFIEQAIAENPESVSDYHGGKKAAAKFIIGQVMRLSKGKANPLIVTELLEKQLAGMK